MRYPPVTPHASPFTIDKDSECVGNEQPSKGARRERPGPSCHLYHSRYTSGGRQQRNHRYSLNRTEPTKTAAHDGPDALIDMTTGEGIESRWADVRGMRLHYRFSPGSGPAIVLLQGGMLDSSVLTWKKTLEFLPRHYRVYAPDLPGYGRSAKPEAAPYTTAFFLDVLEGFLDAVGVGRATVCGSSMSGAVVLGLALRAPERVERLVLSGAYGFQPRVPFHEAAYVACRLPGLAQMTRALLRLHPLVIRGVLPVSVHQWRRIDRELVEDAYAGIQEPKALEAFLKWMRHDLLPHRVRSDFTPHLHRLRMPVLIVHGAYDWAMPVRYARRAHALLPDSRLHVYPNCAHLVPREAPAQVSRDVLAFLNEHDVPAPHEEGHL